MAEEAEAQALLMAEAASDRRAERPIVLDVRELTPICDYFVICSGRSLVHTKAVAESIEEAAQEARLQRYHREGYEDARWIILDYGCVVVHVFSPEARDYYDLERLWADARQVAAAQPAASS
ncbi:MAG: ribosome silencing factor [Armatimonadota bacterium]